jgi:phosphoglycolate phosphatase-like HAD superfamily hydrolase
MIQLVVFDMAGTTVHDDDAVNVCLRQALNAGAGVEADRESVNRVMGEPKPVAIAKLLTHAWSRPLHRLQSRGCRRHSVPPGMGGQQLD